MTPLKETLSAMSDTQQKLFVVAIRKAVTELLEVKKTTVFSKVKDFVLRHTKKEISTEYVREFGYGHNFEYYVYKAKTVILSMNSDFVESFFESVEGMGESERVLEVERVVVLWVSKCNMVIRGQFKNVARTYLLKVS